jgi:hypothetical protein
MYLSALAISALFFYENFSGALQFTEFSRDQILEYKARVAMPAFFLTLIYFIYRYFSGKNPTSAAWPIYVASVSLLITQIIGFITFLPFTLDTGTIFLLTACMLFIVRKAHNTRKKEYFF